MYIESDFQREYGINLVTEIKYMSWRRFTTLLFGLSADSIFMRIVMKEKEVIEDPNEAERAVNSLWR